MHDNTIRRELRVAFSRRAQPLWFRVAKWSILALLAILFWRSPVFWGAMAGLFCLAMGVHLFYRWKTHGWTRRWGGWDDLESGR